MVQRMFNQRSLFFITLSFCLLVALASAAKAQCPTTPLVIDLKSGATLGSNPQMTLVSPITNSPSFPGWKEAVVRVDVGGGCNCATVALEYEGASSGWSLNIGDSPTNNGFGGDSSGSPDSEAELQISNDNLSVYSSALGPGSVENLLRQSYVLSDGSIKFVVCNQYLSFGNPNGFLQTPVLKKLFALPDNAVGNSYIWVGLNRVILESGRRGRGVRRATLSLQ